ALLATTGRLHRRSLPACPLDLRLRLLCVSSIAPEVRYALALSRIAAASCRVFASCFNQSACNPRSCRNGSPLPRHGGKRPAHFLARQRRTPAPATSSEKMRSEEHTSELQSRGHLVCRLLLEKKK